MNKARLEILMKKTHDYLESTGLTSKSSRKYRNCMTNIVFQVFTAAGIPYEPDCLAWDIEEILDEDRYWRN